MTSTAARLRSRSAAADIEVFTFSTRPERAQPLACGLLGQDRATPARSIRRPPAHLRPAHHRPDPAPYRRPDPRLRREAPQRAGPTGRSDVASSSTSPDSSAGSSKHTRPPLDTGSPPMAGRCLADGVRVEPRPRGWGTASGLVASCPVRAPVVLIHSTLVESAAQLAEEHSNMAIRWAYPACRCDPWSSRKSRRE